MHACASSTGFRLPVSHDRRHARAPAASGVVGEAAVPQWQLLSGARRLSATAFVARAIDRPPVCADGPGRRAVSGDLGTQGRGAAGGRVQRRPSPMRSGATRRASSASPRWMSTIRPKRTSTNRRRRQSQLSKRYSRRVDSRRPPSIAPLETDAAARHRRVDAVGGPLPNGARKLLNTLSGLATAGGTQARFYPQMARKSDVSDCPPLTK